MKALLFFVIAICLLAGCKKDDPALPEGEVYPKLLELPGFSLRVPQDWEAHRLQGYDSQVGYVSNGSKRLDYDFGMYSDDLSNYSDQTHFRENVMINGREALIVRPRKKGAGKIGLYIELNSNFALSLTGVSSNEQQILNIFKSVKFL